jgi:hypothetical protein
MPVGRPCSSGQILAAANRSLGRLGFLAGAVDAHRGHGVHRRVHLLDALQAGVEQLDRRDFLGADVAAQLDR